jgi:hypothetical protein
MDEAPDAYAGFASRQEIAAVVGGIRAHLPPERVALADYALWQLGAVEAPAESHAALELLLPRVRDDALHATLAALAGSLAA